MEKQKAEAALERFSDYAEIASLKKSIQILEERLSDLPFYSGRQSYTAHHLNLANASLTLLMYEITIVTSPEAGTRLRAYLDEQETLLAASS